VATHRLAVARNVFEYLDACAHVVTSND